MAKMSEERKLRRQRRIVAAEILGVMLDHPRAADLDPGLRREVGCMMRDNRALDDLVAYFLNQPRLASLAPPAGSDPTVFQLVSEIERRLAERERGDTQ